jgi:hypothetical protein
MTLLTKPSHGAVAPGETLDDFTSEDLACLREIMAECPA